MLFKKNNKKEFLIITLLISDGISVFLSLFLSYYLRNKGIFRLYLDSVQPINVYLKALPFGILLLIFIFSLLDLYEPKKRATTLSEIYTALYAVTAWILIIMAGSYLTKFDYSRIIVLTFYFLTLFFVIIGRVIVRSLQYRFSENGFGATNIIIIGTGRKAKVLARRISKYKNAGLRFLGYIGSQINLNENTIGTINSLSKIVKQHAIHEIYIADPKLSSESILNLVASFETSDVKFKIVSNMFDLITGSVDITNLEYIPSLDVGRVDFPLWKKAYKRFFDVLISLAGIIVTAPFLLIIAFIIKLDSEGPIIISQKRIGFKGKSFNMYKFRTMHQKTPLYNKAPRQKNDERITSIGKFLRRTSLDELPQLINVLKGEMSIVGPRPEMPFIVKKYNNWQKRRLKIKPGLTGLWQILGRKDLPLSENLEYDFYYLNNQSFFLDIVIMLKTIPIVILGKGAY